MPEPMIKLTIKDSPFRYVKDLCFSRFPLFKPPVCLSSDTDDGAPRGAYPPCVEESGKRAGVKSKADEMEYDRPGCIRLALFARLTLFKGSSSSSDIFRDELLPDLEEDSMLRLSSGSEEAREASSRESRASSGGFWIWEKPSRDMMISR